MHFVGVFHFLSLLPFLLPLVSSNAIPKTLVRRGFATCKTGAPLVTLSDVNAALAKLFARDENCIQLEWGCYEVATAGHAQIQMCGQWNWYMHCGDVASAAEFMIEKCKKNGEVAGVWSFSGGNEVRVNYKP